MRYQNVSNQFTTSKKFQTYLSSYIDAHMLTNLEWGAVAYLTHSIYGLCNGTTCEGVNHNNSNSFITGRSGGNIIGKIPAVNVFYSDDSLGTEKHSLNGYYDYKGNKLKIDGIIDKKESISLVASTTKNVTGVYESVMGNMVDSSNQFYPSFATSGSGSNAWNGNSTLDSKFYNSYSNGSTSNDRKAFNRSRLGDATAEVLHGISGYSAWTPGYDNSNSYSNFVNGTSSWIGRGGYSITTNITNIFDFHRLNGYYDFNKYYSFHSSLS